MNCKSLFLTLGLMTVSFAALADFYQIQDISVQSTAASAKEAKTDALTQAQQQAFTTLMRRLVGGNHPFVDQLPENTEIESMVQDFSLKSEKNTTTDYWASVDVQFKKSAVEEFLSQKNIPFLKKTPASLLVVPVYKTTDGWMGIDEMNPVHQFLNTQEKLSDFYDIKLLSGDLDEIVAVNQFLKTMDITQLNPFMARYGADALLFVKAEQVGTENWRFTGEIYAQNTLQQQQTAFDWYQGYSIETAWENLLQKFEKEVREKAAQLPKQDRLYYARLNEVSLSQWGQDQKSLEKLKFVKDVLLQGAFKDQMLISFAYEGDSDELAQKWRQAGWTWTADFMGNSGTLRKGVVYE